MDRPKNFVVDDDHYKGGLGYCLNLINTVKESFDNSKENTKSEKDQNLIVRALFLICFYYKKRYLLFYVWIPSMIIELVASITLLTHFYFYQLSLLST